MTERVYDGAIRTALGLFRVLDFRFEVAGAEHIPATGGAVLACTHVSYFDFMFVGMPAYFRGRVVRFMAKQAVFDNPVSGPLMRAMHHIPVDRSAGTSAFAAARRSLREGELVGVFPEATISRSFVPRDLKSGAARLAMDAEVPLIPMVVWGGQRVWTSGRRPVLRRHVPVVISVGEPIETSGAESAVALTGVLRERMTTLSEAVQRVYPPPRSANDGWWQPAYLGGSAPTPEQAKALEHAAIAGRRAKRSA
jgi:1-acyl-sn-glycerol-3-phosphate acyltransferase